MGSPRMMNAGALTVETYLKAKEGKERERGGVECQKVPSKNKGKQIQP